MKQIACVFLLVFAISPLMAAPLSISSPVQQATLIELYTSEGCYSCPPADQWLATLKSHKQLWTTYVPVAFHVDYWNYLGWRDPFAKAQYSERQRQYASHRYTKTVYTPGLFQNGREWRAWFSDRRLRSPVDNDVGVLQGAIDNNQLRVSFTPVHDLSAPLQLNVAVLGFDIMTEVSNGENEGKVLEHDFVALSLGHYQGQVLDNVYQWQIADASIDLNARHAKGIALWVSRVGDPTPIQAAGGWLR